ncbi:MAG: MSMEG_1061 family FMN-dependent PPOX-type flavoprotein [Pseudolabrys sp.]
MLATEAAIKNVAELEAIYDRPKWLVLIGEMDNLIAPYRVLIKASPYLTLATVGMHELDCSPRGGAPGFVRIVDARTLIIPNRNGNNRIESLRNIVRDPRVALHFLIPGHGESLRVKGRAIVSADPVLTRSFDVNGDEPRTVIVVTVERVYFHCAKAIKRSKLWDISQHANHEGMPTINGILAAAQWHRCLAAAKAFAP